MGLEMIALLALLTLPPTPIPISISHYSNRFIETRCVVPNKHGTWDRLRANVNTQGTVLGDFGTYELRECFAYDDKRRGWYPITSKGVPK